MSLKQWGQCHLDFVNQRWEILRKKVKLMFSTTLTRLLFSIFFSYTHELLLSLEEHRIGAWVYPKLTKSNLAFRDLHWDPVESKVL